jgi:hypothetical protein
MLFLLAICFPVIITGCVASSIRTSQCRNPRGSAIPLLDFQTNRYGVPLGWQFDTYPVPVIIGSTFDEQEVRIILQSINHWNGVVGQEVLRPVYGIQDTPLHIPGAITITEQSIPVDCGTQALGLAQTRFIRQNGVLIRTNSVKVTMHDEYKDETVYFRTAVHELGHALGLCHDSERDSVMFPRIVDEPWIIQRSDIDFLRIMMMLD